MIDPSQYVQVLRIHSLQNWVKMTILEILRTQFWSWIFVLKGCQSQIISVSLSQATSQETPKQNKQRANYLHFLSLKRCWREHLKQEMPFVGMHFWTHQKTQESCDLFRGSQGNPRKIAIPELQNASNSWISGANLPRTLGQQQLDTALNLVPTSCRGCLLK